MGLEDLLKQTFPSKTVSEWEKIAEESLKGKTIQALETTTYENLVLKPLYTRQDMQIVADYPGGSDFRRGIYPLGYHEFDWKVAQRVSYKTAEELKGNLQQAFEKGQTAISFVIAKDLFEPNNNFTSIISDVAYKYPFAINSKGFQLAILSELNQMVCQEGNGAKITGYIGNDPISLFAEEGIISEQFLHNWVEGINLSNVLLTNLRTILIDTTPYHNGGANAVQELGIAIAEGVFYLEKLTESGMELEEILAKMIFQFSIGSNFFMEIAKLRAARVLWNRITDVYGASGDANGMQIAGETSAFTKTVNDPHVNLLRAGNEAFAAVVGGIQYLHVDAFNHITGSTSVSERIARNTQLLLKEEAHLKKVIDPAGGSWYVEKVTNQLAEESWGFFQQIEAQGGILESLKTGWLQKEIASIHRTRNSDILIRKQSIVGTNVYANLTEAAPTLNMPKPEQYFVTGIVEAVTTNPELKFVAPKELESGYEIVAIGARRLSAPYEEMRKKATLLEGKLGSKPSVGMLCLGEIKEHKTRLDFMKEFLAAGGITATEGTPILSVEQARQFISEFPTRHFCLCGTNEQYEMTGHEIINAVKAEFPERIFFLAGLPEKEKQSLWLGEGIKQFIHIRSNCYETLSMILNELEVITSEETKA
ncbi:MAG: methylmalonyl-CoA mutase subunit beta [Bacillus sp. (in: Bacteria)]|nr:methylmalonyl-CoA mutase subunit beta [Bacillus sp. (in: firmicutes)]